MLCAGNYDNNGLYSLNNLGNSGRFLGSAPEAQCVEKKLENKLKAEPLEARVNEVELSHNGNVLRHEGRVYVLVPEGLEFK